MRESEVSARLETASSSLGRTSRGEATGRDGDVNNRNRARRSVGEAGLDRGVLQTLRFVLGDKIGAPIPLPLTAESQAVPFSCLRSHTHRLISGRIDSEH